MWTGIALCYVICELDMMDWWCIGADCCCVELLLAAAAWLLLTAALDAGAVFFLTTDADAVVQVSSVLCHSVKPARQQVSKTGRQQPCRCRSADSRQLCDRILLYWNAWNVCVIPVYGPASRPFPLYFRPYLIVFVYPFIPLPVPLPAAPLPLPLPVKWYGTGDG
jgi:hypothetical protein